MQTAKHNYQNLRSDSTLKLLLRRLTLLPKQQQPPAADDSAWLPAALERGVKHCVDVVSIRFFRIGMLQVLKKFAAFSYPDAICDVGSILGMS